SSLDTICVGTGEGKDAVSAGSNPLIISSLRNFMSPSRGRTSGVCLQRVYPHCGWRGQPRARRPDWPSPGPHARMPGSAKKRGTGEMSGKRPAWVLALILVFGLVAGGGARAEDKQPITIGF